jgi:hypothetical protein
VYQTIINRHEKLGFISSVTNNNQIVDIDMPVQAPIWVNKDTLAAISKKGNMGGINNWTGNLVIIPNNKEYMGCWDDYAEGSEIQSFSGNILLSHSKTINLISVADCSLINTLITEKDLLTIDDKPSITSFAITHDGNFIVLGLYSGKFRLIRYKVSDRTYYDYQKQGINPSISPNNNLVSYLGNDGIHIMKFNGEEDILIIPYEAEHNYGSYFANDNSPYPDWSPDGKELLYHKCNRLNVNCGDIEDYGIYTYNIATGVETFIVDNGINPSWYPNE